MPTYLITYTDDRDPETIEADQLVDAPPFIEFRRDTEAGYDRLLRVRSDDVARVQQQ